MTQRVLYRLGFPLLFIVALSCDSKPTRPVQGDACSQTQECLASEARLVCLSGQCGPALL